MNNNDFGKDLRNIFFLTSMCRISNIATTEYNIIANLDATIESAQTSDR